MSSQRQHTQAARAPCRLVLTITTCEMIFVGVVVIFECKFLTFKPLIKYICNSQMLLLKVLHTFSASKHVEYCESTILDQTKSHRKRWTLPKAGCNLGKCAC